MPQAAPKPCTVCHALVRDGTARCEAHKPVPWLRRPEIQRTTGRQLQRQRAALFTREPLCRECRANGRVTAATIRDHIAPLAEGGCDDDGNIQPLCHACHETKTARESQRGRAGRISGDSQAETVKVATFSRAGVSGGGVTHAADWMVR